MRWVRRFGSKKKLSPGYSQATDRLSSHTTAHSLFSILAAVTLHQNSANQSLPIVQTSCSALKPGSLQKEANLHTVYTTIQAMAFSRIPSMRRLFDVQGRERTVNNTAHIHIVVSSLPLTLNDCNTAGPSTAGSKWIYLLSMHSLNPPRPSQSPLLSYHKRAIQHLLVRHKGRGKRPSILHICLVVSSLPLTLMNYCSRSKADLPPEHSLLEPALDKPNSITVYIIPIRAVLYLIVHTSTTRSQLTEKQRSHKSTLYHRRPLRATVRAHATLYG